MTAPSTVPHTTAWAAEHLRGLGWTVVAPGEVGAAVPEPQVGQTWVAPEHGAAYALTIHRVTKTGIFYSRPKDAEQAVSHDEWSVWVRRTNARPLPTPTDGATL